MTLFNATWNVLSGSEIEAEVIHAAIQTLSLLAAHAGDLMPKETLVRILTEYLSRIKNETTFATTTKALACVSSSLTVKDRVEEGYWSAFIPEIQPWISKSHRRTSIEALNCLISLVGRCGRSLSEELCASILSDLVLLLTSHTELQIVPLVFDLATGRKEESG
jgi:hypothetical protein